LTEKSDSKSLDLKQPVYSGRFLAQAPFTQSPPSAPLTLPEKKQSASDAISVRAEAATNGNADKVMTIVEHLDELRARLIRCLVYIAIGLTVALLLGKRILHFLEAPAGSITFQALSMEEPLIVFFKVAFYCGLVFASPFILFEINQFIAPGLTGKERRIMTPLLVLSPLLFCLGAAFAYYCLLPSMLRFFSSFGQGISPINQRLDFYISLVSSILLYMGICFQLPIVIFGLSFTGLVTSKLLLSYWKYAVFGASVIAAIITPDPTAFSMILVMAALSALYFISVILLKLFGR
jgi:sec-independent protein translocase protein TatC